MELKNSSTRFGAVSIAFHWIVAVGVIGLFALGLWIEDLDYTHPWYRTAPDLHRSIGVIVVALMIIRLVWRIRNVNPEDLKTHKAWEKIAAHWMHRILYLLVILMFPTGYLITTAKGQSLEVFTWFSIPATVTGIDNLEDIAGEIHEIVAFTVIGLVIIHALGALKHHFIDKDRTLKRMLGRSESPK